jgi:hypothetical protein
MRLRAEIVVELEAADFVDAATHQNRLESFISQLSEAYPNVKLTLRERRDRGPKEADLRPSGHASGRLHRYA